MSRRALAVLALLAAAACGDDSAPREGGAGTGGAAVASKPPVAPAENDPAFAIAGPRLWYLIADGLTAGQDTLEITVTPPAGVSHVDLWIDGAGPVRLDADATGHHASADISTLAPGDHEVLLSADGSETAFARLVFTRSHAMYVSVSTDWDDADNTDAQLGLQDELHAWHTALRITHLVGPYTFTDPAVSPARRKELVQWLTGMQDQFGDEVGLHIHPRCTFVETTSVPCRHEPSLAYAAGDTTGYTVTNESYTEAEFETLLLAADALFIENGLPKPTAYRAGAWSLAIHNLRALESAGYLVDSSAVNWARLEEWDGQPGASLFEWTKEHWSTIGDTSQPYYPSAGDLQAPGDPSVGVLEIPDNGALVDYVTGDEMIGIFGANWPGGALAEPRVLMIGYHPPNFSTTYQARIHDALSNAEQFLASSDTGPVVYATMTELTKVWPRR